MLFTILRKFPLFLVCWIFCFVLCCFYLERVLDFIKRFFFFLIKCIKIIFSSFILLIAVLHSLILVWWATLTHISERNPTWLWCILLLTCYWLWFASVLWGFLCLYTQGLLVCIFLFFLCLPLTLISG